MNQEILNKNLVAFSERYPELKTLVYDELLAIDKMQMSIETLSDGHFLLKEGEVIIDSTHPEFFAAPEVAPFPVVWYLIEGFGLGQNFRRAQKLAAENPSEKVVQYIVVEPSIQRFTVALMSNDWTAQINDRNIHWCIGRTKPAAYQVFYEALSDPQTSTSMNAYQILKHPKLSALYSGYFESIWDEWDAARKQKMSQFGNLEDSLLGISNVFENLNFIEQNPGVVLLQNKFKNVPAIVVSAGPSLDRSIEHLKEVADKALIFATDATLGVLLKNGIIPHFTASLERDGYSRPFFAQARRIYGDTMPTQLIAYPLVPRDVIEAFDGPKWVAYRDYGYFHFFENDLSRGLLQSYSSVAHMCTSIAAMMGCSKICFVGQDLAFDPDSLTTHAQGMAFEEWSRPKTEEQLKEILASEEADEIIRLPGNKTESVPSRRAYFYFLKEFSVLATQLSTPLINCTEGGAVIPGMQWQSLADASADWVVQPYLWDRIQKARTIQTKALDLAPLDRYLQETISRLQQFVQISQSFGVESTLAFAQEQSILQKIRGAQIELMKDTRFVCFIIQNAGRRFYEIENEMAVQLSNQDTPILVRFSLIIEWFSLCLEVAERISVMAKKFPNSGSKALPRTTAAQKTLS